MPQPYSLLTITTVGLYTPCLELIETDSGQSGDAFVTWCAPEGAMVEPPFSQLTIGLALLIILYKSLALWNTDEHANRAVPATGDTTIGGA